MFWQLIGLIAACLTSFAFFPQVVKIYRTKSSRDLSVGSLWQMAIGISLWIAYGMYLRNYIIILANLVALTAFLSALVLYYKYNRIED